MERKKQWVCKKKLKTDGYNKYTGTLDRDIINNTNCGVVTIRHTSGRNTLCMFAVFLHLPLTIVIVPICVGNKKNELFHIFVQ